MEGHLDRLRAGILDGWAWDSSQPNSAVCIEVWNANGELLAIGVADQYRADLFHAGKGNGAHGFSIRLNSEALKTSHMTVKVLGESTQLVGSPLKLSEDPNLSETGASPRFDPKMELNSLVSLDKSYASALIEITKKLAERRQIIAKELLLKNSKNPGVINTIFNSASGHAIARKRDVIIFPPIDWDYRYQRPQHLACGLASLGHRVFYIAPSFTVNDSSAPGNVYDLPHGNVFLVKLSCSYPHPEINRTTFTSTQLDQIYDSLNGVISDLNIQTPVFIMQNPVWNDLSEKFPMAHVLYDCLDLISGFEATSIEMIIAEEKLIQNADQLIATSPQLIEYLSTRKTSAKPILVRNATSEAFFASSLPPTTNLNPVIGYLGAIESWFDTKLVGEIAKLRPNWTIMLAGHPLASIRDTLEAIPNIIFLGEVPASQAVSTVESFDVAIIPFLPDGMTRYVNPVKVYEYLASGRGVVACEMPELDAFENYVYQARDASDFCRKIELVLVSNNHDSAIARKMRVINETWSNRALQISNILNLALPRETLQ